MLILLAKIVNTLHVREIYHGNLSPHNIFIDLKDNSVTIDGYELLELRKYANMFYKYKPINVWSPPEVLQASKMCEPAAAHDAYSFGLIMWEMFHTKVPFDNNIPECIKHVCSGERPKVEEAHTEPVANLIRLCWS